MNLLVISHTPHYRRGRALLGWGPTVREIDQLARLFDRVVHLAPLHPESPPESALEYRSPAVTVAPIPPAGGGRWRDKLEALVKAPSYARSILRELDRADVVHVRCPANIGLMAIVLLAARRSPRPRWAKYAGNWKPETREPASYRFQRWWLARGLHRGVVTVNGRWPGQRPHVYAFSNPCLTEEEIREGRSAAAAKTFAEPVRLLYVGRVETAKGAGRALAVAARLRDRGLTAYLDLVGDGPERRRMEELAAELRIADRCAFHGWARRTLLGAWYARSDFLLLPTSTEGWPKVLSEAMAYGVVPVASAVSSIPEVLGTTGAGAAAPPEDIEGFAGAIESYVRNPAAWRAASAAGLTAASRYSYDRYLEAVRDLFREGLGLALPASRPAPETAGPPRASRVGTR